MLIEPLQATVWAFGDNTFGSVGTGDNKYVHFLPQKVTALASLTVVGIAAGAYHSLAVTDEGRAQPLSQDPSSAMADGERRGVGADPSGSIGKVSDETRRWAPSGRRRPLGVRHWRAPRCS